MKRVLRKLRPLQRVRTLNPFARAADLCEADPTRQCFCSPRPRDNQLDVWSFKLQQLRGRKPLPVDETLQVGRSTILHAKQHACTLADAVWVPD